MMLLPEVESPCPLLILPWDVPVFLLHGLCRKFYTEVWLNSGVRGLFLALGFRPGEDGTVMLDPLGPDTLDCINTVLQVRTTNCYCRQITKLHLCTGLVYMRGNI